MEKSIYDLLNEVKMNDDEYEEIWLSSQEKEEKKQRILKEVRKMEEGKKKVVRKKVMAAAACAAIIGITGAANPSLAKNIFSSTFGKLIENSRGEKNEKENMEMYTTIGKNAVDVSDEVEKTGNAGVYTTTVENNGVSVSMSDIYCDGYILYYTVALKTDDPGLNNADWIEASNNIEMMINGERAGSGSGTGFQKTADGTFVKTGQINLINLESEDGKQAGMDGISSFDVEYVMRDLAGNDADAWDESGEYAKTGEVKGEWKLKFPVTIDRTQNETIEIDKEQNGVKLKSAVKTKAGLVLEIETPDFTKAPYNDPYNDPDIGVKDEQGNWLQWLSAGGVKENGDGTAVGTIMVLYDGQEDLTLEVSNKNVDDSIIASIDFKIE